MVSQRLHHRCDLVFFVVDSKH
ncbi:DUF645 domain-containing protein, partial [Vibrio cholerae]|nr:DUF645 domain-containing protein [Vibrio cholerae]MDD9705667.1 DUF645 domain-containing protein [Vibrio cholerae]